MHDKPIHLFYSNTVVFTNRIYIKSLFQASNMTGQVALQLSLQSCCRDRTKKVDNKNSLY